MRWQNSIFSRIEYRILNRPPTAKGAARGWAARKPSGYVIHYSNPRENAYDRYLKMLNEDKDGKPLDENRKGLARELARIDLPLNVYTQWYWKIDLHNLFHFLLLRADPHAQYEIRAYAETILERVVRPWVPMAHRAFADYALGGARLSAGALAVVKRMLSGEDVTRAESGLGPREWRELMATLGRE